MMSACWIDLDRLTPHPRNSNVMSGKKLAKLTEHLRQSGRYPPLIVRPLDEQRFQLLDGHHRLKALEQLGHRQALCMVWDVDDAQALMLLGTLNRLQGQDDPGKRAELLAELAAVSSKSLNDLAKAWPEETAQLQRLMRLHQKPVTLAEPLNPARMPQAVHFFLLPDERERWDRAIQALSHDDLPAGAAVMRLLDLAMAHCDFPKPCQR